ncbi:hypothetical protein [Nocardia sp. NPDC050793]|uniref:hypothetical protein n=1 Tax=Nocardia sp. NPDC050793 TaxID=3155159 RepID=UPI00340E8A39
MTQPDWYEQLPSARTLWRALRTPVFDPSDYPHPEMVAAAVGLLDAHYRHKAAVDQLTRITQSSTQIEEGEWRVVSDFFAEASRDIAALIARVDTFAHHRVLALGLDSSLAAMHPCGLGTVLTRHIRRWALATAQTGTLIPSSTALTILVEEASGYNRLVEQVITGQVHLPAPARTARTLS